MSIFSVCPELFFFLRSAGCIVDAPPFCAVSYYRMGKVFVRFAFPVLCSLFFTILTADFAKGVIHMNKKPLFVLIALVLVLYAALAPCAAAESTQEAGTMRLLHYDGEVEIFDPDGNSRFVLENVRFASGETMRTGENSAASVGLDDTKIVTLDASSRVAFIQESGHLLLNLLEGALFVDVQKKLDENESFDVQTTTMTVGIRGTLLYVAQSAPGAPAGPAERPMTVIGVLEGTGEISFTDTSGSRRVLDVPAGHKVSIPDDHLSGTVPGSPAGVAPVLSELTPEDIAGFVAETVKNSETLVNRVENGSPAGPQLLSGEPSGGEDQSSSYPADGDWTWDDEVTLAAQSASKLYDGTPLMRPSGVLVSGLPGDFSVDVSASGSVTGAGRGENKVGPFHIYNSRNEDVTKHFTNITTISGTLVVDPAPLVAWTGSAEKMYDGTALTCPDAELRTVPGHNSEAPSWQNTSLVTRTALGSEKMVAVSGRTYVHGTNPLTGETRHIELLAG